MTYNFIIKMLSKLRAHQVTTLMEKSLWRTVNSKRSLIDCGVVFVSFFPRCSLRQNKFAKPPQH